MCWKGCVQPIVLFNQTHTSSQLPGQTSHSDADDTPGDLQPNNDVIKVSENILGKQQVTQERNLYSYVIGTAEIDSLIMLCCTDLIG